MGRLVEASDTRSAGSVWRWLAAAELAIAATAVVLDVLVPTLVILALVTISLLVRRESLVSLGLMRITRPWRLAGQVFGLTVLWTALQFGFVMPALNHLTGTKQDLGVFADLEGDLPMLLMLLVASWTLAAFGEEVAYRGYIYTRVGDVLGGSGVGLAGGVLVSSALFGLAHTEQGVIGVMLTFLDALYFSALRLRFETLWASVLAHGFSNTIGVCTFFLIGPVYGLW